MGTVYIGIYGIQFRKINNSIDSSEYEYTHKYGAPFVTSILLLTGATFVETEVTFVESNFCPQKLHFETKVTVVYKSKTVVNKSNFILDKKRLLSQ